MSRKIIHIDMDAFYASVEQRDFPELRGKAIAVGGGSRRGVITTASYEARKFGIRSAMPGFKAKVLCPHLIFVKPRFEAYKAVSKQIRAIFKNYTDLIEPLSLDEAYLDVTKNKINEPIATELAERIQKDVYEATKLTCSAGVSYCKFLAKIASDVNKPFGIFIIKPHQAESYIAALPVEKFYGIGKVTAKKMHSMNILTGADLKKLTKKELMHHFGKAGGHYFDIVRGIDNRAVQTDRKRKSYSVERTFEENLEDQAALQEQLDKLVNLFFDGIKRSQFYGKTLTLKVKTSEFKNITRSKTISTLIKEKLQISTLAQQLLKDNLEDFASIRLMGLTMSNQLEEIDNSEGQMSIEF